MNILNFSTLDRIQQLKENLAQKDKDIIKLDKQLKGIALEDGWLIEMYINITEPETTKEIPYKDSYEKAEEQWQSLGKVNTPKGEVDGFQKGGFQKGGFMDTIFKSVNQKTAESLTVRQETALKMLLLYKQDLSEQRDSIYKALGQAVKSLKIID